jgi:hypothetical protein
MHDAGMGGSNYLSHTLDYTIALHFATGGKTCNGAIFFKRMDSVALQKCEFGGEFDSFADWISFAIAPGIMMYLLVLKDYHKWGFILTFFYIFAGSGPSTRGFAWPLQPA